MIKVSRGIRWVAVSDADNRPILDDLQRRMQSFYANSDSYYSDIDFNENIWEDLTQLPQQDILSELSKAYEILEVGCGKANILKENEELRGRYTGADFSPELIDDNKNKYPNARFSVITDPRELNFKDEIFDIVFSHFVIEHCVFPDKFLDECMRVLKPGGLLIILCPDFLGNSFIPSQRVGFSRGSGRDKLQKGHIFDALVTGFDSKVRLPLLCEKLRRNARITPKFYINTNPACFVDRFQPDVDAVYLTFKDEIEAYCSATITWLSIPAKIESFNKIRRNLYFKGVKRK